MLQVAVGELTESIIDQVDVKIINDTIGIQMSANTEANRLFSTCFFFIGDKCDT